MDDKKKKDAHDADSLEQLMMDFGGVKDDLTEDVPHNIADNAGDSSETAEDGAYFSPFADDDFSVADVSLDSDRSDDEIPDEPTVTVCETGSAGYSANAEDSSANAEMWRSFPKSVESPTESDDATTETPHKAKSDKGKKKKEKKSANPVPAKAEDVSAAADDKPAAADEKPAEAQSVKTDNGKKKKDKKAEKQKSVKPAKPEKVKNQKPEKPAKPEKSKKQKSEKPEKQKPEKPEKSGEDKSAKPSPTRIVITLTAICAVAAVLLSAVNSFTADKISAGAEAAALGSVTSIFDDTVAVEKLSRDEISNDAISDAYIITKDGAVRGYAASVSPSGFGGAIDLMVGVSSSGEVVGVRVISMSETPGLGSKVGSDSFLSRFIGKSGVLAAGEDVDVISGASISSKAVISGVSSVTSSVLDLESIAAARSLTVEPYVRGEIKTTEPVTEEPVVPTAPETAPPDDTVTELSPRVDKVDYPPENIVVNPNPENFNIHADYEEGTTEYETLTTESESTETETAEAAD